MGSKEQDMYEYLQSRHIIIYSFVSDGMFNRKPGIRSFWFQINNSWNSNFRLKNYILLLITYKGVCRCCLKPFFI